ncbi:PLP-dependent aminotransferase family protein [Nonomuraea sp. NPDC049152]|uniref:aminotransferase-like domain-containing protein n=1 Tax=Nonomuraea sp. NPDC049152 TaxID=3154350 RepID=UPI0033F25256
MQASEERLVAALGQWRRPGVPLVAALAGAVREAVLDGRLRTGSRLPAERRLAGALGVSRGTVVAALATLRDSGWVRTRQGSASTLRLPPELAERIAPVSASGAMGLIDLRRAVPAAPQDAFQAAMLRVGEQAGPVLAQDGEPGPGLAPLRSLIAQRYTGQGLATRPEQILVTSGARAAFALLCAHLRPRVAAVESPTYFDVLSLLRGTGARAAAFGVDSHTWDLDQLADAFAAARGGLAYLAPDFQNPTGALMTAAARHTVAELAAANEVTVVADETLRELDLRDDPVASPRIGGAVLIGSASKTLWGGLRIGWIRGPAVLIGELSAHPLCGPLSAAPTQQLLAVELLAGLAPILHRRRAELRRQRDHLAALLAGDERWHFTLPQGGLALWLRLSAARADEVAAATSRAGVSLTPGPRFAADATLVHHLRIPYTPSLPALDRVAAALSAAC